MIGRIIREFSYAMNRSETETVSLPKEPEEVPESDFRWMKNKGPRKRVQGEALVRFGQRPKRKAPPSAELAKPEDDAAQPEAPVAKEVRLDIPWPLQVGQNVIIDHKKGIVTRIGKTKFDVLFDGTSETERLLISGHFDGGQQTSKRKSRESSEKGDGHGLSW